MNLRTIPILLAFFIMGVADAMGPMSDGVKEDYHLSRVMATLTAVFRVHRVCRVQCAGRFAGRAIGKKEPSVARFGAELSGRARSFRLILPASRFY